MKILSYITVFCSLLLTSCEEVIDINLNSANSKVVIQADLNNLTSEHTILISRTVDFESNESFSPIEDAVVKVSDERGRVYDFQYESNSRAYKNYVLKPSADMKYTLNVTVGQEKFESQCIMPKFINVDSLMVKEENFFGDEKMYFVNTKFRDPANQENYYKYSISINANPKFEFADVFNDKFNDGLFVTHELSDKDNSIALGDSVTIIRSIIDKSVYKYWNEFKALNPGNAAPANPTSNISNGALGYFSVSSAKTYGFRIKFN